MAVNVAFFCRKIWMHGCIHFLHECADVAMAGSPFSIHNQCYVDMATGGLAIINEPQFILIDIRHAALSWSNFLMIRKPPAHRLMSCL